jgi:ankyrin repeat protein
MLQENADLLNAPSQQNETAIQAAAHTGQKQIVEFLLDQGAPLDICAASLLGKSDTVKEMLARDESQIHATGAHGIPLAFYAALGGQLQITELLAGRGIDWNAGEGLLTALHGVVMTNNVPMAEWLLAHGARRDAKNHAGQTPGDMAVQGGSLQMKALFTSAAAAAI